MFFRSGIKRVTAFLIAGVVAVSSLSAMAIAADIFNGNYTGVYYATDNDDAFINIESNDIVLVAIYYEPNMYVRDVIDVVTFAPGSGTSNLVMKKSQVHLCNADSTYIDKYYSNFWAQGNVVSARKITAYNKTYSNSDYRR